MPRTRVQPVRRRSPSKIVTMELINHPMSVWRHLKKLAAHNYAEDTLLLYEITNMATSSTYITVPDDPAELEVFKKICEVYDKTKRFAQAGAVLKALIATFPNQRPFRYPSFLVYMPEEDKRHETEAELDEEDYIWYCYYCVLHKTHKYKEAYDALQNIRGEYYGQKREEEIPDLIRHIKNPRMATDTVPDSWEPDIPDEFSSRICGSSLYPVMALLKRGPSSSDLPRRFSNQFMGTARTNVYWWLKSAEAVGNNNICEAIRCLERMTHQNSRVKTELAKLNHSIDKRDEARRLLKSIHATDDLWIDGMDLLAFLSIGDMDKHGLELQEIAEKLSREWPHRVETFIVNGFVNHRVDLERADAFATRALRFVIPNSSQYVYAIHLKAFCFKFRWKNTTNTNTRKQIHDEIVALLSKSVEDMPTSADLALLYADCLMEKEPGHRQAKIFATKFLHENPNNVHAKLLKIHVLVNGISRNPEANHTPELQCLLTSLIDDHPHILAAFCFLLNEHLRLKNDKKCREVFDRLRASRLHFPQSKVAKLHRVTADYLLKFDEVVPAYHHLMAAISTGADVDPTIITNYEQKFATHGAVGTDYPNLAFIDSFINPRPLAGSSAPTSTPSARFVGSPPLQEVVNDHENEQEDSSEYEEDDDDD